MKRAIVVLGAGVVSFALLASGCGLNTHNEIARRAAAILARTASSDEAKFFSQLLEEHVDAFQGGGPFPDWGYAFGFGSASEEAHWEPFMLAAVDYVQEKHPGGPKTWDDATKKLVAFLLGAESHQIADINWHGLGESYPRWSTQDGTGMLRTMGGLEFGCHGDLCDSAHSEGDTGGEFVIGVQMGISWLSDFWYVPSEDLVQIYNRLNYTRDAEQLTPTQISLYMGLMLVGAHAEKAVSSLVYPYYYSKSPYLANMMQDHYLGGIDDNAAWTHWRWEKMVNYFYDTESLPSPPGSAARSLQISRHSHDKFLKTLLHSVSLSDFVTMKEMHRGHALVVDKEKLSDHIVKQVTSAQEVEPQIQQQQQLLDCLKNPKACLEEAMKFGEAVYEWMKNQIEQSAAAIISGSNEDFSGNHGSMECLLHPKECLAEAILYGVEVLDKIKQAYEARADSSLKPEYLMASMQSPFEYFGKSMTVGDFNGDGIDDIAVGAPGYTDARETGSIFGQALRGRVTIQYGPFNFGKPSPIITIDSSEDYGKFGWDVVTADLNRDGIDDLIVSSPLGASRYFAGGYSHSKYRGNVFVYFGVKGQLLDSSARPDLVIVGDSESDMAGFGTVLRAVDINQDGYADLIVGSPYAYGGTGKSGQHSANSGNSSTPREIFVHRGSVSIFTANNRWNSGMFLASGDADLVLRGTVDYEMFGADIALMNKSDSETVLLVSSPGFKNSTGRVTGFRVCFDEAFGQVSLEKEFTVAGISPLSEFGYSLTHGSFGGSSTNYLAVSAPSQSFAPLTDNEGTISLFPISKLAGDVMVGEVSGLITLKGTQPMGRFGHAMLSMDVDHDGVDELVIGEALAHSNAGADGGVVHILRGLEVGAVDPWRDAWILYDSAALSRFGSTIKSINLGEHAGLVISAPRYTSRDPQLEQTGAVFWYNISQLSL